MTPARVALVAVSLLLGASSGAEPLCRARVLLEPDDAVVGQQIVYRLQILRQLEVESVRFTRDLGFPSFRTEWLPGQSPDPAIADVGDHALIFEERRALFPVRAGELEIPAARLACVSARADGRSRGARDARSRARAAGRRATAGASAAWWARSPCRHTFRASAWRSASRWR